MFKILIYNSQNSFDVQFTLSFRDRWIFEHISLMFFFHNGYVCGIDAEAVYVLTKKKKRYCIKKFHNIFCTIWKILIKFFIDSR